MKLIEIAEALGSPDGWNVDKDTPVPLYWFFGNLEISFDNIAPYQMNWFQIEGAAQLRGKSETLTKALNYPWTDSTVGRNPPNSLRRTCGIRAKWPSTMLP
jgi:hypothetical protein